MCNKIKTAIEIIKTQKRKTLTKEELLMLFEKVIEDDSRMGERMTNLEKEFAALKEETKNGFDEVNKKLLEIAVLIKEPSLFQKIVLGQNAKYFWFTVIVGLIILGGLLGVPATSFNGIIGLGG